MERLLHDGKMLMAKPEELRGKANIIHDGGRRALTAMFGRDETNNGGGYDIYAVFEDAEKHTFITVKAVFDPAGELTYPSLTKIIPGAVWYEREINDMFGLVPQGHPDLRPLVLHESFPPAYHPLRKNVSKAGQVRGEREFPIAVAKGEGLFQVPVGPIHAGIIEPGHFRFSQAGESMLQLDAKLFFTHRGIEKSMEGLTPREALPRAERVCGACSIANTWSFCQAVEKISGVQVPRRAEIIRTLLSELERITNHVGDIGNIPAGVGFQPAISLGARLKERLMRLQERIAGNRFLRGMIVLGGVSMDIIPELADDILAVLGETEKGVNDMASLFAQQENFQNRIRTTGIVRQQTAKDLAMVGVGARASGYAHDSRKDFDYGVYSSLNFAVRTQSGGDVAARLQQRLDELAESFSMVRQLIGMLQQEKAESLTVTMEFKAGEAYGISESARGSNFWYVAMDEAGMIDRVFIRSASYPNWPALTIAVQGDIIPDFPLINKSFELCYACIDR